MRIVLDTNVLARAASGPPGMASALVMVATRPEHVLLLSPFLISELSRVLRYERLRAVHGLDDVAIDQYVSDLVLVGEVVLPPETAESVVVDDPDDDAVIATAFAGNAEVLCTKDRHLLKPEIVAYCAAKGVAVVDDAQLLARLR